MKNKIHEVCRMNENFNLEELIRERSPAETIRQFVTEVEEKQYVFCRFHCKELFETSLQDFENGPLRKGREGCGRWEAKGTIGGRSAFGKAPLKESRRKSRKKYE